ncbi:MAG TPA: alpha/beta hydrolase [Longimicrobiales bacterium]|nr:alpha/beta hydrolase [Longimicrobiales bacterium]
MSGRERRLVLERRRVTYREAGAGPPVVLTAGLGLSGRFYDPNLPGFAAAGLRLVVPDLPGFGGSAGPLTGLTVPEAAAWLLAFLDALGIERAGWVGHSVGCQYALAAAARAPERAAGLVLAGPTGAPVRFRLVRQALGLARTALREPPGVLLAVAREYLHVRAPAYLGTWARAASDSALAHAARVEAPTLVLVGDRDRVVARDWVERLVRTLPRGTAEWVERGGHALPRDAAPAFDARATRFLRAALEA